MTGIGGGFFRTVAGAVLFLVAGFSQACSAGTSQPAAEENLREATLQESVWDTPLPDTVERLSGRIDELFAIYDHDNAPGCAVAVYRDGEPVFSRGYGIANLDYGIPISDSTAFYMASVSKQVTAAAAGLLVIRRELDAEARVGDYLDDWPEWASDVRISHLFNHTSGLADLYALMDMAGISLSNVMSLEEYYSVVTTGKPLMFEPGSDYSYTNSGYITLALLVERITGDSFARFVDREILQPLGMSRTHFHDNRSRIVPNRAISYAPDEKGFRRTYLGNFQGIGPGGLYSSIRDWARWESFWVGRPDLDGSSGMTAGEALQLRQMMTRPATTGGERLDYGMGLQLEQEKGVEVHGHTGSFMGFRTDYRRYPDIGIATLVLCNRQDAEPRELQRRLADLLLQEQYEAWLYPLEGIYRNGELPAEYRLRVEKGNLWLDRRLPPNGRMDQESGDLWRAGSWQVTFSRDNSGRVDGFAVTTGRVREMTFTRIGREVGR